MKTVLSKAVSVPQICRKEMSIMANSRSRGKIVSLEEIGSQCVVHEVDLRDSLTGLAIKYGVEVMDIKRVNRITEDREIFAQKTVKIPLPGPYCPAPPINSKTAEERKFSSKGQKSKIPSSIGLLRGYYGLDIKEFPTGGNMAADISSPSEYGVASIPHDNSGEVEGTELAVFRSNYADTTERNNSHVSSSVPSSRWALSGDHASQEQKNIFGERDRLDPESSFAEHGSCIDSQTSLKDSKKGHRNRAAAEVAAVVERLAKEHRESFLGNGVAGSSAPKTSSDKRLIRRKGRATAGGSNEGGVSRSIAEHRVPSFPADVSHHSIDSSLKKSVSSPTLKSEKRMSIVTNVSSAVPSSHAGSIGRVDLGGERFAVKNNFGGGN